MKCKILYSEERNYYNAEKYEGESVKNTWIMDINDEKVYCVELGESEYMGNWEWQTITPTNKPEIPDEYDYVDDNGVHKQLTHGDDKILNIDLSKFKKEDIINPGEEGLEADFDLLMKKYDDERKQQNMEI